MLILGKTWGRGKRGAHGTFPGFLRLNDKCEVQLDETWRTRSTVTGWVNKIAGHVPSVPASIYGGFPDMAIDDVHEAQEYDFERGVVSALEGPFNELPANVAKLTFDTSSAQARFDIQPSNPESAIVRGIFGGDYFGGASIYVAVGQGSDREILVPRKRPDVYRAAMKVLSGICRAVFVGDFSERVEYASDGGIIRAELDLRVDGHILRLGHRSLHNPFQKTTQRIFAYKPYDVGIGTGLGSGQDQK
jgi:hypothetical protein